MQSQHLGLLWYRVLLQGVVNSLTPALNAFMFAPGQHISTHRHRVLHCGLWESR